MTDVMELIRMSLNSIKKIDPYVKEVLSAATQVALYKFNTAANEWERANTEGALFVYSRNGEPYHSIMVMNRLSDVNLIEPIVKDFDYQMQIPFLLYKNSKKEIFGVWFFNREECVLATYFIESIMEGLKGGNKAGGDTSLVKKENGVDIFSMLSKAQEDFNKTPTKQASSSSSSIPTFSSTPRVPDMTPKSVMDFFAKAGSKSTQSTSALPPEQNVLQRLMSNPAHSVEHIEKQQRSVTPLPSTSSTEESAAAVAAKPEMSPLMSLIQQSADQKSMAEKPQLMTPMMFQAVAMKAAPPKEAPLPPPQPDHAVDPLTEKQLAQALIYLLKNDSGFTRRIHEAYVSSLMESLNLSNNNNNNKSK